ncbi:hypothetical protein M9458_018756, partial [Cirrhinus mrigala]
KQVVESYKSGFEPPGDVEFEDYSVIKLPECSRREQTPKQEQTVAFTQEK